MKFNTKILGTGSYLPEKILTNNDIAKRVDTNHQWIVERTGIHERRIADPSKDETPSGMAKVATERALEMANLTANDIDLILFSATIPDQFFPNSGCMLQHKLGMTNACPALDVNAACTGWMYAIPMADAMIKTGLYKHILVVGSEMTSSFNNWDDRNTCILFGDGCGVVLLEKSEDSSFGIVDSILKMDGNGGEYLYMTAGGSAKPASFETVENKEHYVVQEGQSVFKSAVVGMADVAAEIMERNHLIADDISWLIPHQANLRIIDATARRMGLDSKKVIVNIEKYGNTTAGTIPICLSELYHDGKLHYGDYLVLASFGAGYTWGSILIKWGMK
jgi:3-oxoacyl-[acyl-carrier-protein] synthase-3